MQHRKKNAPQKKNAPCNTENNTEKKICDMQQRKKDNTENNTEKKICDMQQRKKDKKRYATCNREKKICDMQQRKKDIRHATEKKRYAMRHATHVSDIPCYLQTDTCIRHSMLFTNGKKTFQIIYKRKRDIPSYCKRKETF